MLVVAVQIFLFKLHSIFRADWMIVLQQLHMSTPFPHLLDDQEMSRPQRHKEILFSPSNIQ